MGVLSKLGLTKPGPSKPRVRITVIVRFMVRIRLRSQFGHFRC